MNTVVIPVETKSRELYGKLWLSLNLVSKDMEVILGDKRLIRKQVFNLDPDFYIAVGAGSKREKTFKELRKRAKIGILDTEGAVFQSKDSLVERYSAKTLEYVDLYFSWGRKQSKLMKSEFSEADVDVVTTGNPRFDLLHSPLRKLYAPGSTAISGKKPYILFITNFSLGNHYRDTHRWEESEEAYYQRQMVNEFTTAVKTLANTYCCWHFIIRPHPSENHDTYKNRFSSAQNISVDYTGDVRTWIYDATAVVHAGSTVGIESKMMETPTIGYLPIDEYTCPSLPINASLKAKTFGELSSELDNFCSNTDKTIISEEELSKNSVLHNWFANANEPTSAGIIAKSIEDSLYHDEKSLVENKYSLQHTLKGLRLFKSIFYTKIATSLLKHNQNVLDAVQKGTSLDFSQYPSLSGQRFQMFPGTSASELGEMKNNIYRYSHIKDNVNINRITPWADVYRIKKCALG
jgi:surface carbohydrate biosynthesis protein